MSEVSPESSRKITNAYHELISSQQTLILASISKDNLPHVSYAPYVRDHDGTFYIYVSELAQHTANFAGKYNKHPYCSFVLNLNPATSLRVNVFVFSCRVDKIQPNEVAFDVQLQAMQKKFGEVVAILRNLPDFSSIRFNAGMWTIRSWIWPGIRNQHNKWHSEPRREGLID